MSRSGNLRALYDDLIREFVNDELYQIREDGSIWTRKDLRGRRVLEQWRESGRVDSSGYIQVSYQKRRLLAHRIVYQKFNGTLQKDLVVDHVNGIRHDNRPENLQLATAKTNRYYALRRKGEI